MQPLEADSLSRTKVQPESAMANSSISSAHNLSLLQTEIAPRWVADADSRGTWTLLYSCVFTLVLCVWTAVHLNIPGPDETQRSQFLRKAKYMVLAIFAPEITVYMAWQQWSRAHQFCRKLDDTIGSSKNAPQTKSKPPSRQWPQIPGLQIRVGLTYGFYVAMGGFAVDVSDMHDRFSQLTLTPTGVLKLAKLGLIEEMSDNEILDKSKADWLAKGLVILQVSWMMLQCISRKAAGYPLAPLEVHTLVHAACAAVMYLIWFQKPLDVRKPTIINTAGFEEPLALMLLQSPRVGWVQYGDIPIPNGFMRVKTEKWLVSRMWPDERVSEASYLLFLEKAPSRDEDMIEDNSVDLDENVGKIAVAPANYSSQSVFPRSALRLPRLESGVNSSEPPLSSAGDVEELEGQVELTWTPPSNVPIVVTLSSGDTLPNGIGPSGFPLQPVDKPGRSFTRLRGKTFKRQQGMAKSNIAPLDKELSDEIVNHDVRRSPRITFYKLSMSLSAKDVLRWSRAGAHISKSQKLHGSSGTSDHLHPIKNSDTLFNDSKYRYLTLRSRNFSIEAFNSLSSHEGESCFTDLQASLMFFLLFLLGLLYGGVHIILWNHEFASRAEAWLWRISCVTLLGAPVGFIVFIVVLYISLAADDKVESLSESTKDKAHAGAGNHRSKLLKTFWHWVDKGTGLFCLASLFAAVAILPLYIFARIFIVVESFLSLRHVPMGVYVQTDWSKYIPHL